MLCILYTNPYKRTYEDRYCTLRRYIYMRKSRKGRYKTICKMNAEAGGEDVLRCGGKIVVLI